ncbi:hypothetical protein VYU27_008061 [Nannochloropsis oceanica]
MEASPRKRHGGAANIAGPGTSPSYMMELPITPVAVEAEEIVILSPSKGFTTPLSKGGGSSGRRHHVPPFHSLRHKDPAIVVKRARSAQELVRAKKLLRALGFFYHLSLGVLFMTFTELLLNDFDNNYANTAAFLGTCAGVERGVQFFTSPFLGNLSDSVGRRPILFMSLLLHLASLLVVAVIPTRHTVFVYFMINGGFNVTYGMINATVADLCTAQAKTGKGELAQQYGKLGMAVGLSMILGPAIGPVLQKMNVLYPVYLSLLFLVISLGLAWFTPESLDDKYRAGSIDWKKASPFYALRKSLKYRRFVFFAAPFFLSQLSEGVYHFMVLYTKVRIGWDFVALGIYISIVGICLAVVQGNLKFIVPKIISENGSVTTGLLGHAVAMGVTSMASEGWMMGLCIIPQMVASLKGPGLMSALATGVSPEEQGVLQGSVSSLRVLSKAIGGPLFGAVMAFSLKEAGGEGGKEAGAKGGWILGLPFIVAGIFDLVAVAICFGVFKVYGDLKEGGGREGGANDTDMMMGKKTKNKHKGYMPTVVSAREGGKGSLVDLEAGDEVGAGREMVREETTTTCSTEDGDTVHSSSDISSLEEEGEEEGGDGRIVLFGTVEYDGLNPMSPW